jgi:hypothetical protein
MNNNHNQPTIVAIRNNRNKKKNKNNPKKILIPKTQACTGNKKPTYNSKKAAMKQL